MNYRRPVVIAGPIAQVHLRDARRAAQAVASHNQGALWPADVRFVSDQHAEVVRRRPIRLARRNLTIWYAIPPRRSRPNTKGIHSAPPPPPAAHPGPRLRQGEPDPLPGMKATM